jgi:anti-anti-sigma factor
VSTERQIGTVKVEFASSRTAVVALIGEHDLDSRAALRATFAYATESRNLLVDLTGCTFIDSAVISLLLATQRRLEAAQGRCELIVSAPAGYVTRLFEVTGLASVFCVHTSKSAALSGIEEFALLNAAFRPSAS